MAKLNDYGIPGDNQLSPFRDSSTESAWKATQSALGQAASTGSSSAVNAQPVSSTTSGLTDSSAASDIKTKAGTAGTGSTAGTGAVRALSSPVTSSGDIVAQDATAAQTTATVNATLSNSINALYQKYYGRDATSSELATHISNINRGRGNLSNIEADLNIDAQKLKLGPYAETAAATTTTDTSSTAAGPTNGDYRSWFMSLVGNTTPSVETLKQLWPTLEKYGVTYVTNTGTTGIDNWNGDLVFPDGTTIDVAHGNGTGGWDKWQWLNPSSGTTSSTSTSSTAATGDYAAQLQSIIKNLLTTVFASDTATGSLPSNLQALYNQIISNPESMSASTVSAMKEAQKEDLLATRQALLDQGAQSAASRGMYNSGWVDQNALTANDAFTSDLTKAYRDIDIEAAKTNSADRIAALNAAAPLYEYSSTLPLNWYTALQNALLGNYNYGLNLASLQEQMQEYMANWLNSSTE